MPSEHIVEVNDETFESEVLAAELPALVDFWGPMCGPCKAMEPMIERLAADYQGRLKVAKVNVNQCPQTSLRLAIRSLPTLVLIKDGKVLDQFSGRPSPAALVKFVERAL
jgi:thioredoxin 1